MAIILFSPITSYGGMGDAYIYKRSFLGQRLKRYPFCCAYNASAVFGAEAEKHRRSRAAAAKRYKRKAQWRRFGGIYKGASPYGLETGYTGKPYDAVTGLSDYGFRDYSPKYARFITEDPIRDGENWFAYVGNNPVNWVDPWGLSESDGVSKTLENTAFVLGTINSLDGGSKIATELIKSGQSFMKAGNKIAWGGPYGQGWKNGMKMIFDGSKTTEIGKSFSKLGKMRKYSGVVGTGLQVVQAGYELRKGNTRYAFGIGGNIVGGQLGAKAGLAIAGTVITATGVGAPVGIAITVVAVGGSSYIFGIAGEATIKALYDWSYKRWGQ